MKPREILENCFGKNYLRDIHTGESIDMSGELDQALAELKEAMLKAVPEKVEIIDLESKPCPYSNITCCTMQDYARHEAIDYMTKNIEAMFEEGR